MILTALLSCLVQPSPPADQVIYVSSSGNDRAAGTSASPLKTLARAVQLAASRAATRIDLSEGNFLLTESVKIPSGVSLTGQGQAKTTIYYNRVVDIESMPTKPYLDSFAIQVRGTRNATFSDFRIVGTVDANSRAHGGLLITDAENTHVKRVTAEGFNFCAIWLTIAKNSSIQNCTLRDNGHPSKESCSGGVQFSQLENVQFVSNDIFENRGAYAFKTWRIDWDHPWPLAPVELKNVRFTNNLARVRQQGGWGNGQPNMVLEFWNSKADNVEIDHNTFNECISLTGESTPGLNYHVHHNKLELEPGYSYAIEASVDGIQLDHNYFKNGVYPIGNFGPRSRRHVVTQNIFDNVEDVRVWTYNQSISASKFDQNTVVVAKPLPLLMIGPDKEVVNDLTIQQNIFISQGKFNREPLVIVNESPNAIRGVNVKSNGFVNWATTGETAKVFRAPIVGAGAKPFPYFKPTTEGSGFGAILPKESAKDWAVGAVR